MKTLLLFLYSFFALLSHAQQKENVIHWNYSSKKITDKTFELLITATIDEGWHIYSQFTPKEGPSLPTTISFNKNPLLTFQGKVKEVGKLVTKHEEILEVDLKYYKNKVDFVQVVKLKNNVKTTVSGTIEFMACTEERCLLPETVKFFIPIGEL